MRSLGFVFATLVGNLYTVVGSAFFATMTILGAWTPDSVRWVFSMARWWSRGLLASSGLRLEVSGGSTLDSTGCYVFMPNHQSLYDIPALIASLPVPALFFAKRSLFQIPIFGWALKAGGYISVDRRDRSHAKESFAKAVKTLQMGSSTVIFPEGTRSYDGALLPFERGGFLLAIKSGAAVVPVGIQGSLEVRKRGGWKITPGKIKVNYGEPIATNGFNVRSRRELAEAVRKEITLLAELAEG